MTVDLKYFKSNVHFLAYDTVLGCELKIKISVELLNSMSTQNDSKKSQLIIYKLRVKINECIGIVTE